MRAGEKARMKGGNVEDEGGSTKWVSKLAALVGTNPIL